MDFIPALIFLMIRESRHEYSTARLILCRIAGDVGKSASVAVRLSRGRADLNGSPTPSGNAKPRELSIMLWNESATVLSRLRPGD
ncbi:MAG: hypothetical protein DMF60_21630 [Acidobacteria bacterium]|nr:MAG: hypothetical protein DMF60_21630 [Acidobacteriota bacterium]